jgi:hypothetical protein
MVRYEGPHATLIIAFHKGHYLDIIMDSYEWPQTALTVALHGGLYLANTFTVLKNPTLPLP